MLTLPTSLRVFAKTGPTDMRKSFEGLVGVVERELGQQVESGDLFLFFNRRGDRVKVLWFAGDGLVIWYKRLEGGTFEVPKSGAGCAGGRFDFACRNRDAIERPDADLGRHRLGQRAASSAMAACMTRISKKFLDASRTNSGVECLIGHGRRKSISCRSTGGLSATDS